MTRQSFINSLQDLDKFPNRYTLILVSIQIIKYNSLEQESMFVHHKINLFKMQSLSSKPELVKYMMKNICYLIRTKILYFFFLLWRNQVKPEKYKSRY